MNAPTPSRLRKILKTAESSSGSLFFSGEFWLTHWRFIALSVASIIFILILSPYTYQAGQGGWIIITLFVHLLAIWGMIATAIALARTDIEIAIISYAEQSGGGYMSRLKANPQLMLELERLEESILPNNTNNSPPAALRMFQQIFKEARDRKFESSVNIMQTYREEALEDIFKLQSMQKIALWLGILGTFIGLLIAIQQGGLRNLSAESGSDFIVMINRMFDGLLVSFSASLAGLEVAVILGFSLLLLRKRQQVYFQGMERAVVTVLSVARNAINKDEFLSELGQVTHELEKVRTSFSTQLRDVCTEINQLQKQIIQQNRYINDGLIKLADTGIKFDAFQQEVREKQNYVIEEIVESVDAVSLRTTLGKSIAEAGSRISQAVSPPASQISNNLTRFNETVVALNKLIDGIGALVDKSLTRLETQLKEQLSRNTETVNELKTRMQSISTRVDEVRRNQNSLRTPASQREISIREFFSRIRW
jgi:methyl-accepting chemotaxis protein